MLLDGLKSRDPDGDPLHFEWKQILGHRVILSNVNEAKATFVAPIVSHKRRYQFSLVVTDMAGPDTIKGADSAPAPPAPSRRTKGKTPSRQCSGRSLSSRCPKWRWKRPLRTLPGVKVSWLP